MKGNKFIKMRQIPIVRSAILVDGGFYRKRANHFWKYKDPKDRAEELYMYCMQHLHNKYEQRKLYRIFYYDCPPATGNVYNPITKQSINLQTTDEYTWTNEFFNCLKQKKDVSSKIRSLK